MFTSKENAFSREMDTLGRFSTILKRDTFFKNFHVVFLYTKPLLYRVLLQKERICYPKCKFFLCRVDPNRMGDKNTFDRVTSLARLKIIGLCLGTLNKVKLSKAKSTRQPYPQVISIPRLSKQFLC